MRNDLYLGYAPWRYRTYTPRLLFASRGFPSDVDRVRRDVRYGSGYDLSMVHHNVLLSAGCFASNGKGILRATRNVSLDSAFSTFSGCTGCFVSFAVPSRVLQQRVRGTVRHARKCVIGRIKSVTTRQLACRLSRRRHARRKTPARWCRSRGCRRSSWYVDIPRCRSSSTLAEDFTAKHRLSIYLNRIARDETQ